MTARLTPKGECSKRGHRRRMVCTRAAERWMACEDCGCYLVRIGARYLSDTVGAWYASNHQPLPRKSILRTRAA